MFQKNKMMSQTGSKLPNDLVTFSKWYLPSLEHLNFAKQWHIYVTPVGGSHTYP